MPAFSEYWELAQQPSDEYYARLLRSLPRDLLDNSDNNVEKFLFRWRERWLPEDRNGADALDSGRGAYGNYIGNFMNWVHRRSLAISSDNNDQSVETFRQFVAELDSEWEACFVTTNYDLIIEKTLIAAGFGYELIGTPSIPQIALRKLHGSLSWFSSDRRAIRPLPVFERSDPFHQQGADFVFDLTQECLNPANLALIHVGRGAEQSEPSRIRPIECVIPPLAEKNYPPLFKSIMEQAKSDCVGAALLVVIGYAFSETDGVVNGFLRDAAKHAKQCVVINGNCDALGRAEQILGRPLLTKPENWSVDLLRDILRNHPTSQ